MCAVDPLTHKEYADIGKAQSAACACDAHLLFTSAVATATDPATHTDASDATSAENDDDDGSDHELPVNTSAEDDGDGESDHELPVNKRPRFTHNRHEHRRCYTCASCPFQHVVQDAEAPRRDDTDQLEAAGSPAAAADGEQH